jgi:N-methylhydantoinase B
MPTPVVETQPYARSGDPSEVARHRAFWNGQERSYIPADELVIDPSLRLSTRSTDDIDPVTLEVLRYALLNINLEHSKRIQKLCVSPITMVAKDFQTSILTEHGDVVFLGPNLQYFSIAHELAVKYLLENRSADPGIGPGDMFLTNDPYVGTPHQPDVCVAAPVFIDGQLFCWVANSLHHADVGGVTPGSFCPTARDAWDDPPSLPPVKLVEGGKLRAEIVDLFVRQSRLPLQVRMDVRAAVAANEYSRGRITDLVSQYGADVVKGAMHIILDAGERLLGERLAALPDGRWSHRAFTEAAVPGDRTVYAYQVNFTKRGSRLIVDNEGTDPQAGAINVSYAPFAGGVLCAVVQQMAADLMGAYGGAYRCVEFRPRSGLANCAEFPAAVSPSGVLTTEMQINIAAVALGKMLSCGDGPTRDLALGPTVPHGYTLGVAGASENGTPFAHFSTSTIMGTVGGRPNTDGVDFGGHWWLPDVVGENVEEVEAHQPILFLYRRLPNIGKDGAGRQRGGLGLEEAATLRGPVGGDIVLLFGESFPKGSGLFGAPPGSRARGVVVRDSDVFRQLADGRVPDRLDDLGGRLEEPGFKEGATGLKSGDVWEWTTPAVGGYGDPLLRSPAAVLADYAASLLRAEDAERVYGVKIVKGEVDETATAEIRWRTRTDRLNGAEPKEPSTPPDGARQVGDSLYVINGRWWCNGIDLGPSNGNHKNGLLLREVPVRLVGPEFSTGDHDMADRIVYREFICPVTGYLVDSELNLAGSEFSFDMCLFTLPEQ